MYSNGYTEREDRKIREKERERGMKQKGEDKVRNCERKGCGRTFLRGERSDRTQRENNPHVGSENVRKIGRNGTRGNESENGERTLSRRVFSAWRACERER